MENYKCPHCKDINETFTDAINHSITYHPEEELDILTNNDDNKYHHLRFKVIPRNIFKAGKNIIPCEHKHTIVIADIDDELETPPRKKQEITSNQIPSDTSGNKQESTSNIGSQTEDIFMLSYSNLDDAVKQFLKKINAVLPQALSYLNENHDLPQWLTLFQSLSERTLPLDNIAYKLFMNVVAWFSKRNSSGMRYNETVRRFWRTGKQLFKGKFIRFMSGLKNVGQIKSEISEPGNLETAKSEINFIVPSKDILEAEDAAIRESTKKPGIIYPLLDKIASNPISKDTPYKLSIDLKKINPGGKFGDVDCFGYEKKPTFHDRQERYKREKSCIKDITQTFVQKVENEFDRNKRVKQLCDIVHILSCRKQDLHELERKREYAFQKLKEESGPKWKESKLAYVLSSIQTSLFEIKSTVEELKKSIRCLLRYGTVWADLLFPENRQVDLKYQSNYLCLAYLDEEVVNESKLPKSVYSQFIKQRSPIWANIRSEACVTGSTVYRAIGLESLRAEQGHFDEVFRAKPPMEPTNETKANMRHGIENEINGIATLVSVVMPSFFHKCSSMKRDVTSLSITRDHFAL